MLQDQGKKDGNEKPGMPRFIFFKSYELTELRLIHNFTQETVFVSVNNRLYFYQVALV